MSERKGYRCVNCGEPAAALYKTYGPSVLKLSKCEHCKGIVDKYIEYDPVIVMIDLVLISKEAQRHVLYNTEFKFFWKVLMLVTLLETFGVWSGDGLFTAAVYTLCHIQTNDTQHAYLESPYWMPEWAGLRERCQHWAPSIPPPGSGFIWEKEFYICFLATAAGMAVFTAVLHWTLSLISRYCGRDPVPLSVSAKAVSIGGSFLSLSAPSRVWAVTTSPSLSQRVLPGAIVTGYTLTAHTSLMQVVYGCGWLISMMVALLASSLQLFTIYHAVPTFKQLFIEMQ